MIVGIGIDMIEVDRVLEKVDKDNGFREKVFSAGEIEFCEANRKAENYAARFETGTVNGGYNTDIAALAAPKSEERGHRPTRVSADLNGGGAPIKVTTTNGGIKISNLRDE